MADRLPRRPLLSVSIPARNCASFIGAQLEALAGQDYDGPWEVVIVDNGSSDGTADVVRRFNGLPKLTLVQEPRRGIGRARNAGVRASSGEWLVFTDADDVVGDGWLRAMAGALADHAFVAGAVESSKLNPDAAERFNPFASPDDPGPQPVFDFLPFAPTGNMGLWRSAFSEVGGFHRQGGSGSDVDLSWRLQLAGYKLHFEPEAVIHYRFRESTGATFRQSMFYAEAHPYLYSQFARSGMPRRPLREAWQEAYQLARRGIQLPSLSVQRQQRWLRDLGNMMGRFKGSLRYRTVYL
ncbi:MAG: glycosyltransferase [Longimicrobiales bacterium]